jgi:hypothetical protein
MANTVALQKQQVLTDVDAHTTWSCPVGQGAPSFRSPPVGMQGGHSQDKWRPSAELLRNDVGMWMGGDPCMAVPRLGGEEEVVRLNLAELASLSWCCSKRGHPCPEYLG